MHELALCAKMISCRMAVTDKGGLKMVAGHLRKQNGIYQMILSYYDTNGKRRTKSISTHLPVKGNKRKAEEMLQKARQEFVPPVACEKAGKEKKAEKKQLPFDKPENGLMISTPTAYKEVSISGTKEEILFCDFLLYWLHLIRSSIDESTYSGYQNVIKQHIIPYFQPKKYTLADIEHNPVYIQDYYTYELNERQVSANTLIHRHANIRTALQYAFHIGLILTNPADRVIRPKKNIFTSDIYHSDELMDLFKIFHGDPLELAVLLGSYYGLRRSEIVGLKWEAIDFVQKTITIRHTVTQAMVDGKYTMIYKDRPKTKKSLRTLPLVGPFEAILSQLWKLQAENRKVCKTSYCTDYLDYIYVDHMGILIKPNYITQHFKIVLKKNGLKLVRFHDLRHSCASLLYASGVSIKDIQEWLGHSDISTTLNIYTHLDYMSKVSSANAIIGILPVENETELSLAAN